MKNAILVIGGAFNPVHTQHVGLLCSSKEELEKTGQWNILGGYLAVAPDNYVKHKLRSSGQNEYVIKLKHRLTLVYEAIKDIPWLKNSPYQSESLKTHYGSAFSLGQRIKSLLNENIEILIVIGGDRVIKRNVPIWRQTSRNSGSIRVCVGRIMDENLNLFDMWKADLNKNLIPNPNEFILLNLQLRSVSSTIIRTYLARLFNLDNDTNEKNEIEYELVNKNDFLHFNVMNYIKQYQHDLYIDV